VVRPASIVWFEWLCIASLLISLFTVGPVFRAVGVGALPPLALIFIVLFAFGLPLLLALLTSRRRSNIAKWLFVILVSFATALAIYDGLDSGAWNWSLLGIVIWVLQLVTVALLFAPSAREWLTSKPLPDPDQLEQTFD
jgi:hypothetical protein